MLTSSSPLSKCHGNPTKNKYTFHGVAMLFCFIKVFNKKSTYFILPKNFQDTKLSANSVALTMGYRIVFHHKHYTGDRHWQTRWHHRAIFPYILMYSSFSFHYIFRRCLYTNCTASVTQTRMSGAGRTILWGKNEVLGEKPGPVPFCPPKSLHVSSSSSYTFSSLSSPSSSTSSTVSSSSYYSHPTILLPVVVLLLPLLLLHLFPLLPPPPPPSLPLLLIIWSHKSERRSVFLHA